MCRMSWRRWLLTVVVPWIVAVSINAQPADYTKMSPLVREAFLVSQLRQRDNAKSFAGSKRHVSTITAFVRADNEADLRNCGILARYGNLYVASIPLESLGWLSRQDGIQRIEAGRMSHVTMDTTAFIVGATALRDGSSFPQSYTGRGVVVGVQDIGFDLTHPNFWSADMSRYRIKALWDQLSVDTLGSKLPVGRDYRDSLSLLSLGRPRDGDSQTHGTHTAGIAAGSGSEGSPLSSNTVAGEWHKYTGIAPDADLCLVCNAASDDIDLIDSADYYKYTFALDALGFKYIFDYADSVGKPCVINFSEGSQEDFQGYDQLYYEMLDSIVGPGHIIVSSAGNEGNRLNYMLKPENTDTASVNVSSLWHSKTISFTTRSDGDFCLRLSYGGQQVRTFALSDILSAKDSLYSGGFNVGNDSLGIIANAYQDSYGTGKLVADWVITSQNYIYPRRFELQLIGNPQVELYAGSVSLSRSQRESSGSEAGDVVVDNSHSILSPGSAPNVICVGMTGYRRSFTNYLGDIMDFGGSSDGRINVNSSAGPTFDGRIKPDVVAPGQNIISSYSSYYIENNPDAGDITSCVRRFDYNGRTYAWYSNMGTSMSAPVVTGVIALWLQANPRLTPRDCLDIIAKSATHYDESLVYPNNIYGYGQIDAAGGMRLAIEKATGIKAVRQEGRNRIYTIGGVYVGDDMEKLPKGVYIVNGKKIIVK